MDQRLPLRVPNIDWTQERIAQLTTLWTEGHSTTEIARCMGLTKNQICGKAHRIGLPPRPSPIKTTGAFLRGLTQQQRNLYLRRRRSGMTPFKAREEALRA